MLWQQTDYFGSGAELKPLLHMWSLSVEEQFYIFLPLGMLLSGPLIEHVGFAVTGTAFSLVGIGFTVLIASRWRRHLWYPDAAANMR